MERITINAVVFRQNGLWVAQCLEYDFVSCAEELEDLPGELMRQIQVQAFRRFPQSSCEILGDV